MQWQDKGIVLSTRKHGEYSLIIKVLTEDHGVYSGVVRYGISKKVKFMFEPGNLLSVIWKARLPEHMGSFTCDSIKLYTNNIIAKPLQLSALSSHCALEGVFLPERENCKKVFQDSIKLIELLSVNNCSWLHDYVRWEVNYLKHLGFGLELKKCAATGLNENLLYVSPKSGRAISEDAAGKWINKLLVLPQFLLNQEKNNDISMCIFYRFDILTRF